MEEQLRKYFQERRPVGNGNILNIELLTDGKSNNHLNWRVVTTDGSYVARVTKPGDMLNYSNLADEYVILKQIEHFKVGPRAIIIDLENFNTPLLIEEFLEGTAFSSLQHASDDIFQHVMDLLVRTSEIAISQEQFPFKFTYTTYNINFKVWHIRLDEIAKVLGEDNVLVREFRIISNKAEKVLEKKELILQGSSKEFIYNDIHPGNLFWMEEEQTAKFIDWQKVSLGDPTFMIALFARRFGIVWKEDDTIFIPRVLTAYAKRKRIEHLDELFQARLLAGAVSDMIWVPWADIKKGIRPDDLSLEKNPYFIETTALLQH